MNLIYQSAFLKALGWSLIDSLWQMGIVWVMYVCITGNGKKFTAAKRHALALFAITAGTFWFLTSLLLNVYNSLHGDALFSISYFYNYGSASLFNTGLLSGVVPFLSAVYIVMACVHSARLIIQYLIHKRFYNSGLLPADGAVKQITDFLMPAIGLDRHVAVWLSDNVETPLTIGFLKPAILLPVAALNHLSLQQTETVIAHELFHIKRNDYLVNLLMAIAEVILFFNPFAWLLQSVINKERENCCDDAVISLGYDPMIYAEALYILGRQTSQHRSLALAATGKNKQLLLERVKRLLKRKPSANSFLKPLAGFFLCLAIAGSVEREIKEESMVKDTKPYYYSIKTDIVTGKHRVIYEKTIVVTPAATKKKTLKKDKPAVKRSGSANIPLPPEPPAVSFGTEEMSSFVSGPAEVIEFSIIESQSAPVLKTLPGAAALPYVPGSTFYYPEMDSTATSKKTVHL